MVRCTAFWAEPDFISASGCAPQDSQHYFLCLSVPLAASGSYLLDLEGDEVRHAHCFRD